MAPAFLVSDLWREVPFVPIAATVWGGGVGGILFAAHLRRQPAPNGEFAFPEAEACMRLLVDGGERSASRFPLLAGLASGALLKAAAGILGVLRPSIEAAWKLGRTVVYAGAEVSPALLGLGFLAGARTAGAVFVGGALSWGIALSAEGWDASTLPDPLGWTWLTWNTRLRYLGLGALGVAAIWQVLQARKSLGSGLRHVLSPSTGEKSSPRHVLWLGLSFLSLIAAAWSQTGSPGLAILAALLALAFALVASLASSHLAGLVGASSVPLSALGLGILAAAAPVLAPATGLGRLLALILLFIAFAGGAAALSAAAIAQNFRVGAGCGVSPGRVESASLLGIAVAALLVPGPLRYLHFAYGIGTGGKESLTPTQANLFAGLAKALSIGEGLPWSWVAAGAGVAIVVTIVDEALKARGGRWRIPPLAVALGTYVPLSLALPFCLGGWIAGWKKSVSGGNAFAAGLVTGDALAGVAIGTIVATNPQWVPLHLMDSWALGLGALGAASAALFWMSRRAN